MVHVIPENDSFIPEMVYCIPEIVHFVPEDGSFYTEKWFALTPGIAFPRVENGLPLRKNLFWTPKTISYMPSGKIVHFIPGIIHFIPGNCAFHSGK